MIIKWLTTSSHGESGSISRGIIRLILPNQEFDTGNICVENWLTICNNLLMDHQQHYWYIKNSSRALQNTNNSICLLNNRLSLAGRRRRLWLDDRGEERWRWRMSAAVLAGCLIWLGGNHHPAESRNIHNNSISREMRRKAALPHRAQLKKLQFDEYWLETNMTKLRRWVTAEARAPQEISQSEKQFVISQTRSKRSNCINTLELSTEFRENFPNRKEPSSKPPTN